MELVDVKDGKKRVVMVRMTPDEAMRTIESLAAQLHSRNPNAARFEKFCDCGADFSIAVHPERKGATDGK